MNHKSSQARAILLPLEAAKMRAAEHVEFLGAWLRRPRQTASVVPSSRYLARLMVRDIDPAGGRVLELGGGTGVFTRAILETGLPPEMLEVVEINPVLARGLVRQFPGVGIIQHTAETVSHHAAGEPGSYRHVISGLPFLAMNPSAHHAILAEAFTLLAPGGVFVQFTYGRRVPLSRHVLASLGLVATRAGSIFRNFPPATVFHIRRAAEGETPSA